MVGQKISVSYGGKNDNRSLFEAIDNKLSFDLSFLILGCVLLSLQLALNSIVFTVVPSGEQRASESAAML